MAEKHKSKYKAPKDEAKSQKPETRKDMKDYMGEEAPNMVPGGVKGVVPNVPRKYATDVIDNVENMVPDIKERLYKKVEDGEYSAEHARKVFEKLQIEDTDGFLEKLERIDHGAITNSMVEPENEEKLQERVDRLSADNKERLIREYVRRKITLMIREQGETEDAVEEPAPTPAPEPAPEPIPEPAAPEVEPEAEAEGPAETPDTTKEQGPAALFQQDVLTKIKSSKDPAGAVTSIFLNMLKNTLTKVEAETGIESDKNSMRTDMIIWMKNNGIL
jgi:hypothetical protein